MAKGLPVPNRKLATLAKHFGCDNRQAHRSITDAEVCAYVFARMALMDLGRAKKKTPRGRE
jgi:DNA polymerase III epsilon subunit-like protein